MKAKALKRKSQNWNPTKLNVKKHKNHLLILYKKSGFVGDITTGVRIHEDTSPA
jgi:hypothetical protein